MTSKATPGPWTLEHSMISWWINTPTNMSRIVQGHLPADTWHMDHEQRYACEQMANGRLVAAAPALLEALQALLQAVCGETGFANAVRMDSGTAYPWPALDIAEEAARAAIAASGV